MTVRQYLAEGWLGGLARRRSAADAGRIGGVRAERFRRHAGNADVVRQELEQEKGIRLSLRAVEREVRHLLRELEAEARATIRFKTPPGIQLQIDFGERRVTFRNERQEGWFAGVESTFRHFGGITDEVPLDNDRYSCRVMTRRPARSSSIPGCTPLPSTGVFARTRVPPTGRAPRRRLHTAPCVADGAVMRDGSLPP